MAAKTPAQVAEKWSRNLANAGQSYKDGVMAVTTAPGELAAQAQDRMLARIQESVNSGKYARNARAVTLTQWQQKAAGRGAANLAAGATAAKADVQTFMQNWLPIMDQVSQQVQSMPKGTEQDAINRMLVVMRAGKRYAGRE